MTIVRMNGNLLLTNGIIMNERRIRCHQMNAKVPYNWVRMFTANWGLLGLNTQPSAHEASLSTTKSTCRSLLVKSDREIRVEHIFSTLVLQLLEDSSSRCWLLVITSSA